MRWILITRTVFESFHFLQLKKIVGMDPSLMASILPISGMAIEILIRLLHAEQVVAVSPKTDIHSRRLREGAVLIFVNL